MARRKIAPRLRSAVRFPNRTYLAARTRFTSTVAAIEDVGPLHVPMRRGSLFWRQVNRPTKCCSHKK
jgi:hypothetical protein